MKYQRLTKKAKTYMFTYLFVFSMLINIVIIILSLILNKNIFSKYCMIVNIVLVLFIILMYACIFAIPDIIINNYKYCIDNRKVEIVYGLFFINRKIIMLDKIYKITVKKTIIGRILNIASITFTTAGGSVKLSYIDEKRAEKISCNVKKKLISNLKVTRC